MVEVARRWSDCREALHQCIVSLTCMHGSYAIIPFGPLHLNIAHTDRVMLQLFAPSQEFYAAVSEDNRLKVWDVVRRARSLAARAGCTRNGALEQSRACPFGTQAKDHDYLYAMY